MLFLSKDSWVPANRLPWLWAAFGLNILCCGYVLASFWSPKGTVSNLTFLLSLGMVSASFLAFGPTVRIKNVRMTWKTLLLLVGSDLLTNPGWFSILGLPERAWRISSSVSIVAFLLCYSWTIVQLRSRPYPTLTR